MAIYTCHKPFVFDFWILWLLRIVNLTIICFYLPDVYYDWVMMNPSASRTLLSGFTQKQPLVLEFHLVAIYEQYFNTSSLQSDFFFHFTFFFSKPSIKLILTNHGIMQFFWSNVHTTFKNTVVFFWCICWIDPFSQFCQERFYPSSLHPGSKLLATVCLELDGSLHWSPHELGISDDHPAGPESIRSTTDLPRHQAAVHVMFYIISQGNYLSRHHVDILARSFHNATIKIPKWWTWMNKLSV